ncbi:MAG: hypothetical protein R3178_04500, partial [Rhodothermales bacterium]|nr:hypothetical protein [Rhodothermales bacterium]
MSRIAAVATLTALLLCVRISYAQIQSTTTGGNWWEETTWTGSQVPGPADDVVVNGPVAVRIGDSCRDLTVSAGGSVFDSPIGAATETLVVNGRLENRGSIEGSLVVNVLGDLVNAGTWLPYTTNLDGTGSQALFSEGAATYGGIMVVRNTVGPLSAGSDLAFSEGSFDLRFQDFSVDGKTLTLDETAVIFGGRIVGDVTLAGTFPARGGLTLDGTVTVTGTLQDFGGGGATETIRLKGSIVNNGVVRDDSGHLAIEVDGEILNNGVWTASHTRFVGGGSQTLSHG